MSQFSARWIIVLVLSFFLLWFLYQLSKGQGRFNAAVRNNGPDSSYSLAKSQLLWWSIIVLTCFAVSFAHTGVSAGILNSTCLLLLGISLGTTAAGKVIDNAEENNPHIVRHQKVRQQYYFWVDMLSDHHGINLHRMQALIFNLLFGIIFIFEFFDNGYSQLPVFDETILGLLGLSSGGYLALKANENNPSKHAPAPAPVPKPQSAPATPVQSTPPASTAPPPAVVPDPQPA